jgi:hypothetical protein
MNITSNIVEKTGYGDEPLNDKMLCEYEVVSNNPLKVKVILYWQSSYINQELEYIKSSGPCPVTLNYKGIYGFGLRDKSKVSTHTVHKDRYNRYYIDKKTGRSVIRIYLGMATK